MLGGAIANNINAALEATPVNITESFENQTGMRAEPFRAALVSVLTVTAVLAILLFFGKYLWNNILHELVPAIKPAKSIWQILGVSILIMLLSPGSCQCSQV